MAKRNQDLIAGPIEGYKIVNHDLTCRDFQFEIGKRHKLQNNNPLELCANGFHFCKYPSGVWAYYDAGRVFKVRAYGVLVHEQTPGADYKLVCEEIELMEEVNIAGHWNTGNWNTGNWNTGDGNTGNGNTGNWNTGDWNAGNWNTGDGNCGNHHSGSLCHGEAHFYLFNQKCNREDVDFCLVTELSRLLMSDNDIDPTPFLSLPNATKKAIKELHKAHKKARAAKKETT